LNDLQEKHLNELCIKLDLNQSDTVRLAIEVLYLLTHENLTFMDILACANIWRIAEKAGIELDKSIILKYD